MKKNADISSLQNIAPFNRVFFDENQRFTYIGAGSLGGKASGLALMNDVLAADFNSASFPQIEVSIPSLTVIRTSVFDSFMRQNNLYDIAYSDMTDDRIAHAFQRASLPVEVLGDLRELIRQVHTPLAIRSSSMLEDTLYTPFAGIYETKMIPNNQSDTNTRFHKLIEAIKFVYASTFFQTAKSYMHATEHTIEEEKMAVIIQEVVGMGQDELYYPQVSGVARSYNFYSIGRAKPEQGVVELALGLGKTIVDGGLCWNYSPAYPKLNPPFSSVGEFLKQTQTEFWAVNMGRPPAYDPIKETEYLSKLNISEAHPNKTLRYVASTVDPQSGRLNIGIGRQGPRVISFAPLLILKELPLNEVTKSILKLGEATLQLPVEIEFALTINPNRFGLLQVRPMVVSEEEVQILEGDMKGENILVASENVLGNGIVEDIKDVVYVKPDTFDAKFTPKIATELEAVNKQLVARKQPYLLIGFGRWGSSDPWLGTPVNWGQVCGAKVIVEATLPKMNVDLSQGSHFFHNINSFQVSYFSVSHSGPYSIDWDWLNQQKRIAEKELVRHVQLSSPLTVKVDGRKTRGVILKC